MLWRFTIIDRNNVAHIIDEPVGWDDNSSEVKRDPEWHGIFFENQGDTFEFDGPALHLLKDEYDQYGVEGNMTLVMEEDCGKGYEEFDRGKFVFSKYEYFCGERCYVKVPVESTSEIMDLRNRINQKVNLDTSVAFDEVTPLSAYNKLGFDLKLPSKAIYLQDYSRAQDKDVVEEFLGSAEPAFSSGCHYNLGYHQLYFGFNKEVAAEIGNYSFPPSHHMEDIYLSDPTIDHTYHPDPIGSPGFHYDIPLNPLLGDIALNLAEDTLNYNAVSNPVQVSFGMSGKIEVLNSYLSHAIVYFCRLKAGFDGSHDSHYDWLYEFTIYSYPDVLVGGLGCPPSEAYMPPGSTIPFTFEYNQPLTLNKGDQLIYFMYVSERKTPAAIDAGLPAFRLTAYHDHTIKSYFKVTTLSKVKSSVSKVYMVNEAFSRVTETITNDKVKAYSEYFGRTDSEPYSHVQDGCGSLEAITDGLRIRRQENKIPGKTNLFSLSLQDMFEGLNPIHNIGVGLEADPARTGYSRLRIEPWQYFYNNNLIMSCPGVEKLTRKINAKDVFSTFQFGYQKWEAEQYTGLDEFLTKRVYRTTLSQVKNDYVKLSKFVASGYALEITRRIGNEDSKDWRYDKDTFIICTKRGFDTTPKNYIVAFTDHVLIFEEGLDEWMSIGNQFQLVQDSTDNDGTFSITDVQIVDDKVHITVFEGLLPNYTAVGVLITPINNPSQIGVELGNVISPANIIDPPTLYNYRISPVRNAMRWMSEIFTSYKKFDPNAKIIFTDGDGNYFAEGEMESNVCKLENGVITENETIDISIYGDVNDAKPLLMPERVIFDYPMTSREFNQIKANPYGYIYFESYCESGYGYIDTINYKPEDGLATFNLIPKII